MLVEVLLGSVVHILLHSGKDLSNCLGQIRDIAADLLAGIAADDNALALCDIPGSDLDAKRNSSHLLLREFEAGALVGLVDFYAEAALCQHLTDFLGLLENAGFPLLDRNDHDLCGRDLGRKHETGVVAVYHDERADDSGGHAPGGLVSIFELVVPVSELDAVGLREVASEVVAGAGLKGSSVVHQGFDRVGRDRAGEFLLFGFLTLDRGDREVLRAEIRVDVEHELCSLLCLFRCGVDGVSLLPHELSGAQERPCLLLPADDAAPLVVVHGKIAVGLDLILVEIAEQGLGSGAHADSLLQLLLSAVGDPGHLGREALDQVALLVQKVLRNDHGEIDVLNAYRLEARVQVLLDRLPDCVARGLVNHEPLNIGIGDKSRLDHDVRIPLCEILIHGCDLCHKLFLICHLLSAPL